MLPLPHSDETLALRLEDVASSLDAGLGAEAVLAVAGGGPGAGDAGGGLVPALLAGGLRLSATEVAILEAAEAAGTLPGALRRRARARRLRAELVRGLSRRLLYPALLLLIAAIVFGIAGAAAGGSPLRVAGTVLVGLALLAGLAWLALRGLRSPSFTGVWLPGLHGLLRDLGEVPYLEALHGLYAAGVPLDDAHARALRATPVAWVRRRLFAADQVLQQGRPLTEALAAHGALDPETLRILTPAEQAGELEDGLRRALERRRHTLRVRAERAVRILAGVLVAAVYLYVIYEVLSFYAGYYGRLPGGR